MNLCVWGKGSSHRLHPLGGVAAVRLGRRNVAHQAELRIREGGERGKEGDSGGERKKREKEEKEGGREGGRGGERE